jgi:hypothetical protein
MLEFLLEAISHQLDDLSRCGEINLKHIGKEIYWSTTDGSRWYDGPRYPCFTTLCVDIFLSQRISMTEAEDIYRSILEGCVESSQENTSLPENVQPEYRFYYKKDVIHFKPRTVYWDNGRYLVPQLLPGEHEYTEETGGMKLVEYKPGSDAY